jgi:hypothetical protein
MVKLGYCNFESSIYCSQRTWREQSSITMWTKAFKSRTIFAATVVVLLCFLGLRCAIAKPQILEFEHVLQYKLELDPSTKVPDKISGLCGASSYCIQDVTSRTNGTTLVMLVRIGVCKKGQSGNFSFPLSLSDGIQELRFGEKQTLIWTRSTGKIDAKHKPQ